MIAVGTKKEKVIMIVAASVVGSLSVAYIIYNIVAVLIIGGAFSPRIDYERMEKLYNEDYELLKTVVDYFADSEHTSIFIRLETDLEYFVVSDDNVSHALITLRGQGYSTLYKDDNIIRFPRSSRGRHFGNGIVYSIDGVEPNYGVNPRDPLYGSTESPTQIMYLTRLEPLSKPDWYYYEADFREWRSRYRRD